MYEHRTEPLLPRARFLWRVGTHLLLVVAIALAALGVGVLGYHFWGGLPWIDALLNASMILGGMGPVDRLDTPTGKLFASGYALFSGVVFLISASIFVAPLLHRLLHRLHVDTEDEGRD